MHDVEGFLHKLKHIGTNAREIAHKGEAALRRQQSMVLELRNKRETMMLERRRRKKAVEDEIEDLVALMRRYQLLVEMKKRDIEQMTALADIYDTKQQRVELHTLALQLHKLLQAKSAGFECFANIAANWAGLKLILIPGRGYRICLTLLDPRQPQRCCSLLLLLDSKGKYKVLECEPALASLDGLVTELRQTCNLVQFVHHLRQQFKKLLLAHPPSAGTVQTEHNEDAASA
uniref:Kinetochore protein SPC25 n=1 Tax=Rhipicephalus appendiculatus TaxID=34631 RepID=A0A131Z4P7_RHIAP